MRSSSRPRRQLYRAGDAATGLPACSACHSPTGAGIPKNYPRLSGQHADYTYAQLKAFKAGERGNDKDGKDLQGKIMAAIAAQHDRHADEGAVRLRVGIALNRPKITPRFALRDFRPTAVSAETFGRPGGFRVVTARSAPIAAASRLAR